MRFYLTSPLTSPHLTSLHLTSPHLTSSKTSVGHPAAIGAALLAEPDRHFGGCGLGGAVQRVPSGNQLYPTDIHE